MKNLYTIIIILCLNVITVFGNNYSVYYKNSRTAELNEKKIYFLIKTVQSNPPDTFLIKHNIYEKLGQLYEKIGLKKEAYNVYQKAYNLIQKYKSKTDYIKPNNSDTKGLIANISKKQKNDTSLKRFNRLPEPNKNSFISLSDSINLDKINITEYNFKYDIKPNYKNNDNNNLLELQFNQVLQKLKNNFAYSENSDTEHTPEIIYFLNKFKQSNNINVKIACLIKITQLNPNTDIELYYKLRELFLKNKDYINLEKNNIIILKILFNEPFNLLSLNQYKQYLPNYSDIKKTKNKSEIKQDNLRVYEKF